VTEHGLVQAVQSNALRLAPASAQELEEREAERIDAEKLRLLHGDVRTLKDEVSAGFDQRRAQAAQAEADRAFAEKENADKGMGFPELPEYFRGRRRDRNSLLSIATGQQ
jgi:hypothetical protein